MLHNFLVGPTEGGQTAPPPRSGFRLPPGGGEGPEELQIEDAWTGWNHAGDPPPVPAGPEAAPSSHVQHLPVAGRLPGVVEGGCYHPVGEGPQLQELPALLSHRGWYFSRDSAGQNRFGSGLGAPENSRGAELCPVRLPSSPQHRGGTRRGPRFHQVGPK
ncbi:hypothetical protein J437_LFUL003111 [Ladona fulva]|uniref:Uncharacterized protein n=1 Tax=Ladona fulva TaxID=123851 RepID=A0A8K0NVR4_LADFU|nr:hypothetical protein J437_LFUL003111 [Ladona fulva]